MDKILPILYIHHNGTAARGREFFNALCQFGTHTMLNANIQSGQEGVPSRKDS